MNKNKKIISASLALALGVSLLIPNAKANEEKTLEKVLKEPAKTSETVKTEEKSAVVNEKITIKKAPANEGGEKPADGDEKPADGEKNPTGDEEKPEGETEKPDDKTENPKTDEEKQKDEKKVKPREFKMSEVYKNKDSFEVIKTWIMDSLRVSLRSNPSPKEEKSLKAGLDIIGKAKNLEELMEATKCDKAFLAKIYLFAKDKITYDEFYGDLVKIIDDMANQKPQNPSQKNPNRKNKKTGTTNSTNTVNTGNKVSNAGENVQTGVGSLSAILCLLGASSLGLFKSKRK